MKNMIIGRKAWVFAVSALLLVLFASISNAETEAQTRERMIKEAKETADQSEKAEKEGKGETNYDVKKTHDEHIKETEKAAGEAEERKNKSYSLPDPCLKNISLPEC
jgi:hypothetical protein